MQPPTSSSKAAPSNLEVWPLKLDPKNKAKKSQLIITGKQVICSNLTTKEVVWNLQLSPQDVFVSKSGTVYPTQLQGVAQPQSKNPYSVALYNPRSLYWALPALAYMFVGTLLGAPAILGLLLFAICFPLAIVPFIKGAKKADKLAAELNQIAQT